MKKVTIHKLNAVILLFFGIIAALHFGSSFLIPFTFSIMLAMLMTPIARKLESMGMKKIFSSTICVLIILSVVMGSVYLLSSRLARFTEQLPQMQERLVSIAADVQIWVQKEFDISANDQREILKSRSDIVLEQVESLAGIVAAGIFGSLVNFLLVLVYVFLFILNREKYRQFVLMVTTEEKKEVAKDAIYKISKVAEGYLGGRLIVMSILGVMYLATFVIMDIQHAILLTVFGAVITVIPYLGPLISAIFPVLIALITEDRLTTVLILLIALTIIQLIESYVLEPLILSRHVDLSPLAIIIAILVGGALWNIAGMILFVPLLSMLKIVFDHVPSLQPYGYLIGDTQKSEGIGEKLKKFIMSKFKKQ